MYRPNPSCDRARIAVKIPNYAARFGDNNLYAQVKPHQVNFPITAGVFADQRGFSTFSAVALASCVSVGVLANLLLFEKYVTPQVLSNFQGTDELLYRRVLPVGEGIVEGLALGGLIIAAATVISRIRGADIPADKTRESRYTEVRSDELADPEPPKSAKKHTAGKEPVELSSSELGEVLSASIDEDGTLFGAYKVTGKLGEGGFGAVLKAEWIKLKETVAIKVVKQADLENLARFRDEARVMVRLNHPNIIRFYSYEEKEGYYCIIMEYVEGRNLYEIIKETRKPMDEKEALSTIRYAAKGLAEAYELGLLHRDIKPGNIMKLKKKPWVKVLDFGLAKGTGTGDHTRTGMLAGSATYVAPERIKKFLGADVEIDHRSDIYSLVCVLYFLLTGQPPFKGESQEDVLRGHLRGDIPDVRALNPGVTPGTAEFINRGLQKDPNDRFATYEEFDKELERLGG